VREGGTYMKFSRSWAVVGGLVLSMVGTLGWASPASAAYSSEPLARAWEATGPVHSSLAVGSRLYVGGLLDGVGGVAALDASTGALIWSVPTDGDVRAMTLSSDGSTLFVGGGFTHVNGVTHRHLAAIATDSTVLPKWRASTGGMVRDLVVSGDTLYVGGQFAKINGVAERGLGTLVASTGKTQPGFTGYVDKNVYGLALTSTSLVVVGNFLLVNGSQARSSIASFDRTTGNLNSWAPHRLCSGCSKYWDVVVDDNNAYVSTSGAGGNVGGFDLTTGRNPWSYVHADGDVQSLLLPGDGLLYIGGHFGEFVGSTANDRELMAAIDPSDGSVDPNFHPHFFTHYPGVWALAVTQGVLWGGGDFTGVESNGSNNHVPYLVAFGT
jgi:outer membrane protein assembly factor BamB